MPRDEQHVAIIEKSCRTQENQDVQNIFVHLHPVHTKNNINSLAFQDDKAGQKHSPNKLKWDFMDHPIGNHSAFGGADRI
jgi:hypothetical protein